MSGRVDVYSSNFSAAGGVAGHILGFLGPRAYGEYGFNKKSSSVGMDNMPAPLRIISRT